MKSELVSVVIPAHNRVQPLIEAVESVVAQTYRPIELIVVDDASAKPLASQLERFGDEGVTVEIVRNDRRRGPGHSRERGRQRSHGAFIAYLDSDDIWHPEKTIRQVDALQASGASMAFGRSYEFRALPRIGNEPLRKGNDVRVTSFLPAVLMRRPWPTSSCLWTRSASDSIGAWFPGFVNEDYEYDCRAGCLGLVPIGVHDALCYVRLSGDRQSVSLDERALQSRCEARLSMARCLSRAGLMTGTNRALMLRKLAEDVLAWLDRGEHKEARSHARAVRQFIPPMSPFWWAISFVTIPGGSDKQLARLVRRYRPSPGDGSPSLDAA